ncbi:hypothetical protein ACIBCM_27415 [Streptomyces sp. NPDC051018]|uniref:hypothetical protein n=1 Tax=Streptomyces sp. NPDC051018 TaxID=3365639 RepID=UPI0037997927
MGNYTLTLDGRDVRVHSLPDAQLAVMEYITDLVARAPEAASQGALMANKAFSAGTVERALNTHGSWHTVITVHGEQVKIAIAKRRWWQRRP